MTVVKFGLDIDETLREDFLDVKTRCLVSKCPHKGVNMTYVRALSRI